MKLYSVAEVAAAAGVNSSTVSRHVKDGKLKTIKDALGKTGIEASEIFRVYQVKLDDTVEQSTEMQGDASEREEKPRNARESHASQLKTLRTQVRSLKSQVELLHAVIASKEAELQRAMAREAESHTRELWHREQASNFGYQVLLLLKQVSRIDDPGFSVQVSRMEESLKRLGDERE